VDPTLTTQFVSDFPGTSEGSSVLQIEHPEYWTGNPWIWLEGAAVAEAISQSTALKFDISAPEDFAWRQAFIVIQGSPVNWGDTQTQFDLMAAPLTPYTVEFDLSADYLDSSGVMRPLNEIALDAFDEETDWFQLLIVFQGPDNLPLGTGITYLDNVRLVQPDSGSLDGDYNDDGRVDAADYVVWRNNEGAAPGTLPNDPTGTTIGEAQYNLWVASYGSGRGGGSAVAVPEPGVIYLTFTLLLGLTAFHVRRSKQN
jgi:hypothetical protein